MPSRIGVFVGRAMMGMGIFMASLIMAACGSSSAKVSPRVPPNPACTIASADLSLGTGSLTQNHPSKLYSGVLQIDSPPDLTSMLKAAAQAFDAGNKHGTVSAITDDVAGGALHDTAAGVVNVGFSDFYPSQQGGVSGLTDTLVAVQIFTLVVSPDLAGKITNLTTPQLVDIFAGHDTNWKQVGGPNIPINVVVSAPGSLIRTVFTHYVLGNISGTPDQPSTAITAETDDEAMIDLATSRGAIGYLPTRVFMNPTLVNSVFPICINGNGATAANVEAGTYGFWNIEHAFTKSGSRNDAIDSVAQGFIGFVRSANFQQNTLPMFGYLQLGVIPISVLETHQSAG